MAERNMLPRGLAALHADHATPWRAIAVNSLGVAALIMSFNTPLPNVAWKAFPAVLCGNTAVFKPAGDTPLLGEMLVEIFAEAGLPKGVLQVLPGGAEAALTSASCCAACATTPRSLASPKAESACCSMPGRRPVRSACRSPLARAPCRDTRP